jgi:hypothetical protein
LVQWKCLVLVLLQLAAEPVPHYFPIHSPRHASHRPGRRNAIISEINGLQCFLLICHSLIDLPFLTYGRNRKLTPCHLCTKDKLHLILLS